MSDGFTPGMIRILRAAQLRAVQVSLFNVYSGDPSFSRNVGSVDEKVILVKNGFLKKDRTWSTHYIITDEGHDILAEIDAIPA